MVTDRDVDPTKYRLAGGAAVLLFGVIHGAHDALDGAPLWHTLLPTAAMLVQAALLPLVDALAERRGWRRAARVTAALLVSGLCGAGIRFLHPTVGRGPLAAWLVSVSLGLGVLMLWLLVSYLPLQLGRARAHRLAAEAAQRSAELERLRSHLHPHFLLNTLNAVAGLVTADPRQARQLLIALGDLLRDALEEQPTMRTLGDEIAWLRRYAEIFEIRHAGAVRFTWEVAPDTLEAKLPRLLLQPLLENAIEHGALKRSAGSVAVIARRAGDQVAVSISDDGPGMPKQPGPAPTGLGLRLARDRLQLAYPALPKAEPVTGRMTIDSSDAGTRVTLLIPAAGGAP